MRTGKRRIASGIAACMIALSTAFTGVGQREVKAADISVSGNTVFLRGHSVVIEDVGGGRVSFYADDDKDGVKDSNSPISSNLSNKDLSGGYIVGADLASDSTPSYRITVNGGNIGTVMGENAVSGCGPVSLDINGGTISTFYAIYNNGSPNNNNSDNDITINLKGGTITNFNLASPNTEDPSVFSIYINNETGRTINGTSHCSYMNELSSGITVSGNYVMKKNMTISKKLTVTSDSTMKIPSGKSFTTGGVIANSGVIKCEGSFTKTGSNKALGQIWFKNLPTLEGDISSYISTSGNSICFPLTMTNASDANGLCQLLTVTANPESVAAGEWAKLTKPSFYVKAGSQFTASVASNEYNYTNDKINQFYCTGDSSTTKTDLEKITGGFRGTMPSEPATLYVSLSDPVAKQDPILGSAPISLNAVEGQTLGDIYPNGTLNLNGTPGTFNWVPVPTTSVGAVGTKAFQMKFVPDNPNLYNTKTFDVSVTVAAATNTCTTHTYGSAYESDSTGHWQVCTNCGQATEKTGHTLTSTVTQRATSTTLGSIQRSCTVCDGIVSTESISRTSFTKVTTMDAVEGQVLGNLSLPVNGGSTPGTYSWVLGNSTSVGTEGTHVFSIRFTPTDTVKYAPEDFEVAVVVTKAHTHDYSVRNKDASGHWYECECGEKDSSTFSVHSYIMNKNSYGHWNECECGYKTSVSSHSNTTAAITRKASSTRKGTITTTCDACGYVIATEDIEKTDFGLAGTITALTEDTLGDLTIPDNSGSTPGAFSWVSSASTSVGSVGTHTFKMRFTPNDQTRYEIEEFDVSVTVSERHTHSYVIRDYDSINHWFKCSCGEKNTASSESHTYETKCNEQGHWKECFCGYRTDTVAHSKTTAVITKKATSGVKGVVTTTCDDCGYVSVTGIDVSLHVNRIDKSADDMVIGSIGNKGRVGDAISTVKPFSKYNSTDEDKGTYTWNDPDAVIEMEKRYEVLFVPNDMNNYNWSGSERAKYDPNKGGFVFKLAVAAYESGSDEEVQEINKAALEDFEKSVVAIGDVDDSDSCELRIKAARAAYDALSDELKEEVDPLLLEKLQVAEVDYNKAKEASTKAKLDKEAAERLVTLAKSIGEIKDCTETTYAKIAEVKKAYAELTDDQKALVSDEVKALIENAENTFNELKKKEAEKEVVEETTAETPVVEPQPEVTPVPTTEEFDPFLPPVTPPKEEPVVEKETIKVGMKISGSGNKVYKVTKFTNKGVGEVAYIGSGKKAKTVTIPATVTYKGINLKVTSIAANTFKGDKKLETVNIGNNIVKIGANAFNGCISLKKVVMGSGVELIDSKAFFNCKSLNLVTINSTVLNKIKTKAFTKAGAKNYKKLVVKTPGSKLNKYKGWLKKAGLNKKCKVKKK